MKSRLSAPRAPGQAPWLGALSCASLAAAVLLAGHWPAIAQSAGFSDWDRAAHSAVRLIDGGPRAAQPGDLLAGVEIRLDTRFLTYWRNPGDAGVAPMFDLAASDNVEGIAVDYPAPSRLDEAGEDAFGYTTDVVFPLHVTRRDPTRPATLVLHLDYAVCATQCIPAKANLRLPLGGAPDTEAQGTVASALARVPHQSAVGAPGPLAVTGLTIQPAPDVTRLLLAARGTPATEAFVEAPEGWYLEAERARATGPATIEIPIKVVQRPDGADLKGTEFRFTLVESDRAVDVTTSAGSVAPSP